MKNLIIVSGTQISHTFTKAQERTKYTIKLSYSNAIYPEIDFVEAQYGLKNNALNIGLISGIFSWSVALLGLLLRRFRHNA